MADPTRSPTMRRPLILLAVATALSVVLAAPTSAHRGRTTTAVAPSARAARDRLSLRLGRGRVLASGAGLASISCASARLCVALDARGRAWRFDGSRWSGPRSPGGSKSGPGSVSVSCAGPACVAAPAGSDVVSSWTGKTWSAPTALEGAVGLEAVGCARGGYCAAVDGEGNSFALDGDVWERTAGDWGSVRSIACVSAVFCMSAGPSGISNWDGGRWTLPATLGASSAFTGISCPSARSCTAVDDGGQAFRWNGSAWSAPARIEPGRPSATALGPEPTGISCPTASLCVAVDDAGGVFERRAGAWSRVSEDRARSFTAVSCPDSSFCAFTDTAGAVLFARPQPS